MVSHVVYKIPGHAENIYKVWNKRKTPKPGMLKCLHT